MVFVTSARGCPMDYTKLRKSFARAMKKAGVSGNRLYDLRHSLASHLLAREAPITYVAAQLGHSKPSTTLGWYCRWLPQSGNGFIDRLKPRGLNTARGSGSSRRKRVIVICVVDIPFGSR